MAWMNCGLDLGTGNKFFFSPIQPPIQWVPGSIPRIRVARMWSWPFTSI